MDLEKSNKKRGTKRLICSAVGMMTVIHHFGKQYIEFYRIILSIKTLSEK